MQKQEQLRLGGSAPMHLGAARCGRIRQTALARKNNKLSKDRGLYNELLSGAGWTHKQLADDKKRSSAPQAPLLRRAPWTAIGPVLASIFNDKADGSGTAEFTSCDSTSVWMNIE